MAKDRMRSVDATVKKILANLFSKDVFPAFTCLITLADVKTTPDLRQCNVYVSVLGTPKQKREVMKFLENHKSEYYAHLGNRLRMKYTPTIRWFFDETAEKADNISRLIDDLDIPEGDE